MDPSPALQTVGTAGIDDELAALAGQLNVVHARLVEVAQRVLATGAWEGRGQRTPAAFLAWQLGLSPERAKVIVDLAARRGDFPTVVAMFDRGALSLEQVAEAVKAPAWADADIAHFVSIATVSRIRRAMHSNLFVGDPDDPTTEQAAPVDRLRFGVAGNGRWRISAELGIDDGLRIEAALTERRDALFEELGEQVTLPAAFVDCFDCSLDAVESASRRDRYRAWLHLDVTSGDTTTTDGWRIPMAVRDHLLCDGVVQPVWERDGIPFSVGRGQRVVPDRTRRVVERRDRGCRVPGCTAARFVEIHHVRHWLAGGTTDTWNLVSLCPCHHRLHHQGRLGIAGDADRFDGLTFTDEEGRVIAGGGRPFSPDGPTGTAGRDLHPTPRRSLRLELDRPRLDPPQCHRAPTSTALRAAGGVKPSTRLPAIEPADTMHQGMCAHRARR